jgi:thiol-disulfide isomerase/thioredoxin
MIKNLLFALLLAGLSKNVQAEKRHFANPLQDSTVATLNVSNLRIGDKVPPVQARWVKGNVTTNFKKGMVYVLEFWATWCGPCKKAMPHISALAKKHTGKAVIIGVNVWERPQAGKTLEQTVDEFVQGNSQKMTYNICMDGADGYMAKNFVEAAAQPGIPATMIVDKEGKLAWIGHPESMDIPLQQIINGTFNTAAFKTQMDAIQQTAFEQQKQAEALSNAIKPLIAAATAKDYPAVISEYTSLMASHAKIVTGEYYKYVTNQYYTAILHVDAEKAYTDAIKFHGSLPNEAIIAAAFAMHEGLDKKFYRYALEYYAKQKEDIFDLPALAAAHFHMGNAARAVELQEQWIESTKKFSSRPSASSTIAAANQLNKYKAALK